MKYLITQEDTDFIRELVAPSVADTFIGSFKLIEPLSEREKRDLVKTWFADDLDQWVAVGLLDEYEKRIFVETK